jgi:hypothetical protein
MCQITSRGTIKKHQHRAYETTRMEQRGGRTCSMSTMPSGLKQASVARCMPTASASASLARLPGKATASSCRVPKTSVWVSKSSARPMMTGRNTSWLVIASAECRASTCAISCASTAAESADILFTAESKRVTWATGQRVQVVKVARHVSGQKLRS